MTILLTFKVAQGVILAADSRMTIIERDQPVFLSDTQEKLFALTPQIGILVCGTAFLGQRAAQSWIREFSQQSLPATDMSSIAQGFLEFLPPADSASTTFILSGFNPDAKVGLDAQFHKLTVFADGTKHHFDLSGSVSFWDGQFEALTRLLLGRSPIFSQIFADDPDKLIQADTAASLQIPYYAMTLQEGVEFARFLIQSQIHYQRFSTEPQTCGGPIDIAYITPEAGFQWVSCKTIL
jgi:hypothetical protein